jgi:hypothetical protein
VPALDPELPAAVGGEPPVSIGDDSMPGVVLLEQPAINDVVIEMNA